MTVSKAFDRWQHGGSVISKRFCSFFAVIPITITIAIANPNRKDIG
jgi:hypothetical protein